VSVTTPEPSLRRVAAIAAALRVLPVASLSPRRARKLLGRNFYVYRRAWPLLISGLLEPLFYLLSIGIGLGHLVGTIELYGHALSYRRYVAPALLAAAAMNGSLLDTTYELYYKLTIARTYEGVLATPLSVADVALGELAWAVIRGATYSTVFLGVMAALGLVASPFALLAIPTAALVAFAFAAAGMAATSFARSWADLEAVFLFVVPSFLFSGVFYPLSTLPHWVASITAWTPLYQGVEVARALDNGFVGWGLAGHAGYLVAMGMVALAVTSARLERLLAS